MKLKMHIRLSLIALILVAVTPLSTALAHGEPVVVVDPAMVAAGGTITITGSEMENGETFAITLEGIEGSISLGEVTATGEPEAGFVVTFTIPEITAPGSYTVRAATDEGEVATADLTVTAPTKQASAVPATVPEMTTAEAHELDRTKPVSQIILVIALIALSSLGGFILVRRKG